MGRGLVSNLSIVIQGVWNPAGLQMLFTTASPHPSGKYRPWTVFSGRADHLLSSNIGISGIVMSRGPSKKNGFLELQPFDYINRHTLTGMGVQGCGRRQLKNRDRLRKMYYD